MSGTGRHEYIVATWNKQNPLQQRLDEGTAQGWRLVAISQCDAASGTIVWNRIDRA